MSQLTRLSITLLLMAAFAVAAPIGSWRVDAGPNWPTVPPAYTGQEAAALLFGGSPSDYAISISDTMITNTNWVSVWSSSSFGYCGGNYPCGIEVAENYKVSTGGLYQNPGDTSAYVYDWALGAQYTNYAYRVGAVPEPGSLLMMAAGIGAIAIRAIRRRS